MKKLGKILIVENGFVGKQIQDMMFDKGLEAQTVTPNELLDRGLTINEPMKLTNPYMDLPELKIVGTPKDGRANRRDRRKNNRKRN